MDTRPSVTIRRGTSRNRLHRAWLRLNYALRTCRCPRCAPAMSETPVDWRCVLRPAGYLDVQVPGFRRLRFWVCLACEDHAMIRLARLAGQRLAEARHPDRPGGE